MTLIRSGDADYASIYGKWQDEGYTGWVIYAGVQYQKMMDIAGVIAFESFTTTALLDSRSLTGSTPSTYNKLDDGGHDV